MRTMYHAAARWEAPPVIYRLLGELTVGREGRLLSLPGGHRLTVLGVLLLNANRQVSTPELLRAAWGSTEVNETQLHKCVSSLRTLLNQVGRRGDLVTHSRSGYEMRLADDDLDMLLFQRLVRKAEEAGSRQRTADEVDLLGQALQLWRGQHPLSNVAGEALQRDTTDLEQRRKRAAVRLFELEIGRRHYDRILGELHTIAGYYPTDRRLCAQLMVALYRSGHATEAVAAYERYSAALDEVTGGVPDTELRNLNLAIARGDQTVVAKAEAAVAPRSVAAERLVVDVPAQLAPGPAGFVGRDNLVAEMRWLLSREQRGAIPVVVVSGPGGIGKTALALYVAHQVREQYPDGQLYVELRGNTGQPLDTSEVLAQLLRGFGVSTMPETRHERMALYRTVVANRRVLVVLDDARDEAQIRDLIPGNPACNVLVTARQRLPDIDGAHHVARLEPLLPEIATKLFLSVVGRSGVDSQAEPEATEHVVALCAGLPLALCIAGALRVRDFGQSTADLAARLARQRPEAFAYGERSVARSIGAGLDRLDDDGRRLFLGLGLLRLPDVGLWTAAAVLHGTTASPGGTLLQLASTYLIQPAGPGLPYRLHDLTREYAHQRAENEYPHDNDRRIVLERTYGALLTLTRRAHRGLYGGDFEVVHSEIPDWDAPPAVRAEVDRSPLAWFEAERLNIRAAVSHCAELGFTDLCWDLMVSTHEFYTVGGYFDDWYATGTVALQACRDAGDLRGEGLVLAILGQPALVASRRVGASGLDDLQRSVDLLAGCHDRHGRAIALRTLANALRRRGHLARPLALFAEALEEYEASGDTVGRWQTLRFIGQTHLDLGHDDEALRVLRTAEHAARELAQPRLLAQTAYWIGQAHLARRELAEAQAAFQVVFDAYGDGPGPGHAYAAHGFGDAARLAGELPTARHLLDEAAGMAHDAADAVLEGRVYLSLAALHEVQGDGAAQLMALTHAADCFAGCDAVDHEAGALAALGAAKAALGDAGAAQAAWTRVDTLYTAMDLPEQDRIHHHPAGPQDQGATAR